MLSAELWSLVVSDARQDGRVLDAGASEPHCCSFCGCPWSYPQARHALGRIRRKAAHRCAWSVWRGGVSYTATDLEKKVAFYRIRAAEAATRLDKQYWLRIATYWRALQRNAPDDVDDQVN